MVGPVSLRHARHLAAVAFAAGTVGVVVSLAGARRLRLPASTVLLAGWAANAVALSWRRTVRPRHLLPLAGVSALAPWVYLWHWWRGVFRFRHRPRL